MSNLLILSKFTGSKLFNFYLLCSSILVLKLMGIIVFTVLTRMKSKAFISEEDANFFKGEVKLNDNVERVRRAVQNDLENILPFLIIGFFYLFIDPPEWLAYVLYSVFVIVRILHSIVYAVFIIPQPTRAILWAIGFFITGLMTVSILIHSISIMVD